MSAGQVSGSRLLAETARAPLSPGQVAPAVVDDADLERASAGRAIRVGSVAVPRRVARVPLEVYVAQVLAGEGEPGANEAATQALAVAVRTYLIANAGRHGRDGYDFCDSTHCQVPRRATAATRRAAAATTNLVLRYRGAPAEVFYSASCGGRSEAAATMWSGTNAPYLESVADDVHEDDAPWTLNVSLAEVRTALARAGIEASGVEDVRVASRTASGRVARLWLGGPAQVTVTGSQFRMALGAAVVRSTAFTIERTGDRWRLVGHGYGHGVGMCVIGAGRRAARGDTSTAILAHYFPGLQLAPLDRPLTSR